MPLYTFYPRHPNGDSGTFVTRDLAGDDRVAVEAMDVLASHESAAYVEVWRGETRVHVRPRVHPALASLLGRRS